MPDRNTHPRIASPQRLAELEASGLLDCGAIEALDALTEAAHRALGIDTTTAVTAITGDRQVMVSVFGAGTSLSAGTSVPLSHSLCQHVVIAGAPYVVGDATADPLHAPAVRDHGVGAYVGSPLRGTSGAVLGAVCASTPGPRQWTDGELSLLQSLARTAECVVAMHTAARSDRLARIDGTVPLDPAARVQHDLRTPLTSLIGYLALLLEDASAVDLSDRQLMALMRCHASAGRLRDAVEHLAPPSRESALHSGTACTGVSGHEPGRAQ